MCRPDRVSLASTAHVPAKWAPVRRQERAPNDKCRNGPVRSEGTTMTDKGKSDAHVEEFWHSGKVTRRRLIGYGAGAIGAAMLVPAPWRAAFGAAKPLKIGSPEPLAGASGAR